MFRSAQFLVVLLALGLAAHGLGSGRTRRDWRHGR